MLKNGKGYIKEYDYNNVLVFEGEYSNERINGKGIDIDKKKIKIDVPINNLGVTNVNIVLHKKVSATLKVELQK